MNTPHTHGRSDTPPTDFFARGALLAALTELSASGVFVRGNYQCCQSCAGASLETEGITDDDCWLYWHEQDHEQGLDYDEMYLAWGGPANPAGETSAQLVCTVLRGHGLAVEHDGDEYRRIKVSGVATLLTDTRTYCNECEERVEDGYLVCDECAYRLYGDEAEVW